MPKSKSQDIVHSIAYALIWTLCIMVAIFALVVSVSLYRHRETSGIITATHYQIHGIDISHHQGKIDWGKVKRATLHGKPISFVFARCTNGYSQKDRCYDYNREEIRKHGFLLGAYHYFVPGRSAEQQAQNFIRHSHLLPGDLPPVLDVEERGRLSDSQLADEVVRWMNIVGKHYNCTPMLYANPSFKRSYLHDARMQRYPFWKSRYMNSGAITGNNWVFCQYTRHGHVAGIKDGKKNYVDLDVFYSTPEDLKSLLLDNESENN